jgi:hypothetical protein
MYQAMVYVGALIALGGLFLFLQASGKFIKTPLNRNLNYKKILWTHLGWMALSSAGLGLTTLGATLNFPTPIGTEPILQAAFGGFLFMFFIQWLYASWALYNYKKDLDEKYRPVVLYSLIFTILPVIVSLWVMTEGLTPITTFPLPKGIPAADPVVTFYALFILTGAVFVYYLADLQLQAEGYRKGYAENVFYIAFPTGILGARIWYVIGQWGTEFAGQPWWKIFAM